MDNGTDNSYMIWVTCCKINDKRHILAKVRLLESVEANHDSLGCSSLLLHPNSPCDPILQGMGSCSRSWFQVRMHLSLGQVIKCAALSILLRMMCNDKINIYIYNDNQIISNSNPSHHETSPSQWHENRVVHSLYWVQTCQEYALGTYQEGSACGILSPPGPGLCTWCTKWLGGLWIYMISFMWFIYIYDI